MEIFSASDTQNSQGEGVWVGFTSRAVGINCCDSIEVGSLLWKILISEGACFFIYSYHPIPGEKKRRNVLFIYETQGFSPIYVCLS